MQDVENRMPGGSKILSVDRRPIRTWEVGRRRKERWCKLNSLFRLRRRFTPSSGESRGERERDIIKSDTGQPDRNLMPFRGLLFVSLTQETGVRFGSKEGAVHGKLLWCINEKHILSTLTLLNERREGYYTYLTLISQDMCLLQLKLQQHVSPSSSSSSPSSCLKAECVYVSGFSQLPRHTFCPEGSSRQNVSSSFSSASHVTRSLLSLLFFFSSWTELMIFSLSSHTHMNNLREERNSSQEVVAASSLPYH